MQLKEFMSNLSQATLLCGGEYTCVVTSQIIEKDIYIYVYVYIYKILSTRSIRGEYTFSLSLSFSLGVNSPMGII